MDKTIAVENRIPKKEYRNKLSKLIDHLDKGKHTPVVITQSNKPIDDNKTLCEVTFYYEIEELDEY